jgi:hypothetical protein
LLYFVLIFSMQDDQQFSGSGTSSSFSVNRASMTMSVSASTAGVRIRQTLRRFNCIAGGGLTVLMALIPGSTSTGITRRFGYFDASNGLFYEFAGSNSLKLMRRSFVTGSASDTTLATLTAGSGLPSDWLPTTGEIYGLDLGCLGVGDTRFFLIRNNDEYTLGTFNGHALTAVATSTPNLPVRYELQNSGSGGATSMEVLAASVLSDGGQSRVSVPFSATRMGSSVAVTTDSAYHSLLAIRLDPTTLHVGVELSNLNIMISTATCFASFKILYRPTVAGAALSWSSLSGSNVQFSTPILANTLTNGITLYSGYIAGTSFAQISQTALESFFLGSLIDGTTLELHLAVQRFDNDVASDVRRGTENVVIWLFSFVVFLSHRIFLRHSAGTRLLNASLSIV